ncbi:MAG: methylated-DNA--[protein]-cysteine S-methyltransferase [Chloroflexi bacterium]|nr:methylated-DNA--[protein]-cysteine S-methyltransferase [Chloroflexota bacterium]
MSGSDHRPSSPADRQNHYTDAPSHSLAGPAGRLTAARLLRQRLRGLEAVTAPPSLLPGVLDGVGLETSYVQIASPIGPVFVAFAGERIVAIAPASDALSFVRHFRERFGRSIRPATEPPAALLAAIQRRLAGEPVDLDFDLSAVSEFERAVLLKALEIPRGEVRPYGWIAREIGRPGAVRAVGSALHKNPIPLLIPCHRVVKSDGRIGEYALGVQAKLAMLAAEGLDPDWLAEAARHGAALVGDRSSREFCYPTCRWVPEIPPERRVTFPGARAALAAGYRPCDACRPAAIVTA